MERIVKEGKKKRTVMTCHKLVSLSECLKLLTLFSVLPTLRMFLQYISARGDSKSGVEAPSDDRTPTTFSFETPHHPHTTPTSTKTGCFATIRTGRGGEGGNALSLYIPLMFYREHEVVHLRFRVDPTTADFTSSTELLQSSSVLGTHRDG
jgi:hypothetical protein